MNEEEQEEPAVDPEVKGETKPELEDVQSRLRAARERSLRNPASEAGKKIEPEIFQTLDRSSKMFEALQGHSKLFQNPASKLFQSPAFKFYDDSPLRRMDSQLLKTSQAVSGISYPRLHRQIGLAQQHQDLLAGIRAASGIDTMGSLGLAFNGQSALAGLRPFSAQFSDFATAVSRPALAGYPAAFGIAAQLPNDLGLLSQTLKQFKTFYEPLRFSDLLDFEVVPDEDRVWIPEEFWEKGIEYFEEAVDHALRTADGLAGPEEAMRLSMALLYFKELDWKGRAQELFAGAMIAVYGPASLAAMDAFFQDPNPVTFVFFAGSVLAPVIPWPGTKNQ